MISDPKVKHIIESERCFCLNMHEGVVSKRQHHHFVMSGAVQNASAELMGSANESAKGLFTANISDVCYQQQLSVIRPSDMYFSTYAAKLRTHKMRNGRTLRLALSGLIARSTNYFTTKRSLLPSNIKKSTIAKLLQNFCA